MAGMNPSRFPFPFSVPLLGEAGKNGMTADSRFGENGKKRETGTGP